MKQKTKTRPGGIRIRRYRKGDDRALEGLFEDFQEFMFSINPKPPRPSEVRHGYGRPLLRFVLEEIRKGDGALHLAEASDGRIVGYSVSVVQKPDPAERLIIRSPPKRGEVTDLYVDPSCRKGRVGRRLIKSAEAHLKARGCREIIIGVFAPNLSARAFYRKLGYSERSLDLEKGVRASRRAVKVY